MERCFGSNGRRRHERPKKEPGTHGRHFSKEEAESIAAEMLVMSQIHNLTTKEKMFVASVLPQLLEAYRRGEGNPEPPC